MTLDTNGAMFEFKTESDDQFAKDYYQLVDTDIPLFAVKQELLYMMDTYHLTHFSIPGTRTRDHQDHSFFFEIERYENSAARTYKYLRYR